MKRKPPQSIRAWDLGPITPTTVVAPDCRLSADRIAVGCSTPGCGERVAVANGPRCDSCTDRKRGSGKR